MENQENATTYQLECVLEKARNESFACIFVSGGRPDVHGQFSLMAGLGATAVYSDLDSVPHCPDVPIMGYVGYDVKNQIESSLSSSHAQLVAFDPLKFVLPKVWLAVDRQGGIFGDPSLLEGRSCLDDGSEGKSEGKTVLNQKETTNSLSVDFAAPRWRSQTSKDTYIQQVERIKQYIVDGDFYEMNYCIAFTAEQDLDPYHAFLLLHRNAPAPFSVFLKDGNRYLLCASPERFFGKRGDRIFSQPIKGTRPRVFIQDTAEIDIKKDAEVAQTLMNSEKDRAENVMIVDLVRNDLSKVCEVGSVVVPECCAVYSFSHVHQLISTVEGKVSSSVRFHDLIRALFPMGSMTGAPKISVMQHTEQLESFSRGIYSGTVGYIWKNNMDFNVVIRALQYDAGTQVLAYAVGGAITYDSVAEDEYQECLDKASAVLSIFSTDQLSNL